MKQATFSTYVVGILIIGTTMIPGNMFVDNFNLPRNFFFFFFVASILFCSCSSTRRDFKLIKKAFLLFYACYCALSEMARTTSN